MEDTQNRQVAEKAPYALKPSETLELEERGDDRGRQVYWMCDDEQPQGLPFFMRQQPWQEDILEPVEAVPPRLHGCTPVLCPPYFRDEL